MKKHGSTIFLFLILLIGLSLLLYPSFSDWWNSFHQSRAISTYSQEVANIDNEMYEEIWEDAWEYNRSLVGMGNHFILGDEQKAQYENLLNIGGNGIMGYVEIPNIDAMLPIYHGTAESVLQIAVGHLDWTSLPVGGTSSHCVVSGHRGLPSARLFTDLDQIEEGDIFLFHVLDEVLTYEVDQIRIVEPHEIDELLIQEGKDLCTLVTCTPYGVNSHRMLVRGHRIDNIEEARKIRISADAMQIDPLLIAPVVAAPILLVLLIALMLPKPSRKKRGENDETA